MNLRRAEILIAVLVGLLFGMAIGAVAVLLGVQPEFEQLRRNAVLSGAAYWGRNPGTGQPELVWEKVEKVEKPGL